MNGLRDINRQGIQRDNVEYVQDTEARQRLKSMRGEGMITAGREWKEEEE